MLTKVVLAHRTNANKFNALKPDEFKNGNYKSAVGHEVFNGRPYHYLMAVNFWGYTYPIDKVSPNQYVSGFYANLC
ncbi:MAG: hypothetical protein ACLS5G_02820 [Streptococcus sp.]